MKSYVFMALLATMLCGEAFRQPSQHLLSSRLGLVQAPAVSGGSGPLSVPPLGPLLSGAAAAGRRLAAAGAASSRGALASPEIRLAIGMKTASGPVLRVANSAAKRVRRALGVRPGRCMLESGEADRFASGLSDLLLLNAALRGVAQSYPSSSLSRVVPSAAKLSYIAYAGLLAGAVKDQWLAGQPEVLDRAGSLAVLGAASLAAADVVSSATKMPLGKTLALGGIGSALSGLFVKDLSSNVFGGLTVVLNDRFKPGDEVTFKASGTEYSGKIERIGLTQTTLRSSKDQRVTYIPNALLAQAPVTIVSHSAPKRRG